MIEVGKCYKMERVGGKHYYKFTKKYEGHKIAGSGLLADFIVKTNNGYGREIKDVPFDYEEVEDLSSLLTEIPESEYKAKLAEVKQILEEMEK